MDEKREVPVATLFSVENRIVNFGNFESNGK